MILILDSKTSQRKQKTSNLGFILAAAGSAVGLGTLWDFDYRASQEGGYKSINKLNCWIFHVILKQT